MDGLEVEELGVVAGAAESSCSDDVPGPSRDQDQLDICRVCLVGAPAMRGLFHEDGVPSLADRLMFLASVKMMPGDGLPSHICCDCGDKLESAYKFKIQVEQADTILRQKLDSLNIKEELFFNDVDVTLTTHRNDVEVITEDSLLLKDHIELLDVQKINEGDHLQNEHEEKQVNEVNTEELEIEKHENEENSQLSQDEISVTVQEGQEMQGSMEIENDHEIQQISNEKVNQSFEERELQEMVLNEISDQEKIQEELDQSQHVAMHEHDYVVESQLCENSNENKVLTTEETELDNKEDIETKLIDEEIKTYDLQEESTSSETVRRSKRINQQKDQADRDFDEENYFENLNLSSRLKKIQSDKLEKIFFMCYLCERQFLSKDVLKEHMYSHEEVRKVLSFSSTFTEKVHQKTPEKSPSVTSSPILLKSPSSGKHPNTCPHCGKEYLYIISYNKHLIQHEKEKNSLKENSMPLEVSFHEDDDTLDFHDYDDNQAINSSSENDENKDEKEIKEEKDQTLVECNIREEESNTDEKLKEQCSKDIDGDASAEQNLKKEDLDSPVVLGDTPKTEPILEAKTTEEARNSLAKSDNFDGKRHTCPECPLRFRHKNNLTRHLKSHNDVKSKSKQNIRARSFHCNQCNKSFGNELTLKNHTIATGHKTNVHGEDFNVHKRTKRVAARVALKYIDKIKTDLILDESDEEQEKDRDKNSVSKAKFISHKRSRVTESNTSDDEQKESAPRVLKKFQKNTRALYCATCNQKCSSKQALTRHMEQHVKDENAVKSEDQRAHDDDEIEDDDDYEGGIDDWQIDSHECATCKKKYSTKKSLLRHQLLHEEPNYECDICNVKFYRKDKLKAHYDKCSEKNPDQVRKCNICGDSFENNELLREHRVKHVDEGILTEEDLMEIDPKPDDKNSEKGQRKRRTDITGLQCTECNKHYTSRKGLLRHLQVHEGKKYLCDICPKKFYRQEHLKIHVAKHNMVKPYKCPRCSKRFMKEELLNNHIIKHDRISKKPKETTSDGTKRFLCEICSKSFTQSTTLVAHLRAHNGIKPYVCEVCSRPFTTNAYLKMHMRTHTQERPYICQYCSRAFARADTLANHLTSHTGEAKYHCKYCPKHFRRLKSLKEHVFIHTGQRPYACPTCDRRFNNNGSRYAHSKRCKQNLLQTRQPSQSAVQSAEQEVTQIQLAEQQPDEQEVAHLQLIEHTDLQSVQQPQPQIVQRIGQVTTTGPTQIIKPQSIKTITIARPVDAGLGQQHVMAHQEILMPLILPFTVTLSDVGDEVILSEGTKIFTT